MRLQADSPQPFRSCLGEEGPFPQGGSVSLRERDAQHPLVSGADVVGKELCFSASSVFLCSHCSTEVGIASPNETVHSQAPVQT